MSEPYEVLVTIVDLEGNKGATGATGIQGVPGQVTNAALTAAMALKANLASPTFTGTPAASTAATDANTAQIATTAQVRANRTELEAVDALKAPLASPAFTGVPVAPTAATSTNTTQVATTAYLRANRAELEAVDALKAPIQSPTLTGTPLAPTPTTSDNTTKIATTAHVRANRTELESAIALDTDLVNPIFTGNVIVPVAVVGGAAVNKTQMDETIVAEDAKRYPYISPNPPETNRAGRFWMKTPENHTAVNIGGDNFAPLWPPTDNRAVNAKAAVALLEEAVGWWDAGYATPGEQYVKNRGSGGDALNARYGSVAGNTVIQDGKAVFTSAGQGLFISDTPGLDIAGDIEIVARISADAWSSGVSQTIVAKWGTSNQSYLFRVTTLGVLEFYWSPDGTSIPVLNSGLATIPSVAADDQAIWVKVTFDVNNGSSGRTARFFYSLDNTNWEPTQWSPLGSPATSAGVTSIYNSSHSLTVGIAANSSWPLFGTVYRAIVRNGIGGTTVLDVDCSLAADHVSTFYARTGHLVTVNPTGLDTNDPLFLPHTGENYAALGGTLLNRLSIPAGAIQPPGDIEQEICWTIPWDSSGAVHRRAFGTDTTNQWSLTIFSGAFYVSYATGGTTYVNNAYGTITSLGSGKGYLRVRRASATGVVTAHIRKTLNDPWVAVSVVQPSPAPGPLDTLGSFRTLADTSAFDTWVHSDAIRYSFDGPDVFRFDADSNITDAAATNFIATTGQTVTVTRSTTGRRTTLVTRPVWLFGTDDYMEVPDNELLNFGPSDSFTALVLVRQWSTPGFWGRYINKAISSPGAGWSLSSNASTMALYTYINDGVDGASRGQTMTTGKLSVLGTRLDREAATLATFCDTTFSDPVVSTSAIEDLSNSAPLRIGTLSYTVGGFQDMELVAAAVFRRSLTTEEITLINDFYGTV